ncbi:hypothetical protein [Acinetobacter proteolyticus]|uniref:hypothetical protein n=1 Tax=Acinetobacter proteolyticus TaxID=1776741 RepID=UPI003D980CFE
MKFSKEIKQNMRALVEYTLPSNEVNKIRKSIFTKVRKEKENAEHQCLYKGCVSSSAGSHEISRSLFIEPFSKSGNKVCKLKKAFDGNVNYFKYSFDRTSDCTVFKGFCSKHDSDLFQSFENDRNFEIDNIFILKQSLRTLRREIFELEQELYLFNKFKKNVKYFLTKYSLKIELKRMIKLFDKISVLIEDGVDDGFFIERLDDVPQTKVQFSDVITEKDYIRKTGNPKNTYVFIFLFYVNGKQNLILACHGEDKKSLSRLKKIKNQPIFGLNQFILDNKDRIVLSEYFIERLKAGMCENKFLEDTNIIRNPYTPNFVTNEFNDVLLFNSDDSFVKFSLFD